MRSIIRYLVPIIHNQRNIFILIVLIISITAIKISYKTQNCNIENILIINSYITNNFFCKINFKVKKTIFYKYQIYFANKNILSINNILINQEIFKIFKQDINNIQNILILNKIKKFKLLLIKEYCIKNFLFNIINYIKENDCYKKQDYKVNNVEYGNVTIKLRNNFFKSAKLAGLKKRDIEIIITALKWQLDFKKLKEGDELSLLKIKNKKNKNIDGELIGIKLHSGGKNYYAFKAYNGKFYNKEGVGSLECRFMKLPTKFNFRISSKFNPRRINPVTGKITPHRGVDLAVPIGTPVLSVGDGEIITIKNDNFAGNYITVKHEDNYLTRYMHLNKILVYQGQKVKKGEVIALSGNTGYSTGPHIHFEVWINQQAVNPLNIQCPFHETLIGNEKKKYLTQVEQVLPKLNFNMK